MHCHKHCRFNSVGFYLFYNTFSRKTYIELLLLIAMAQIGLIPLILNEGQEELLKHNAFIAEAYLGKLCDYTETDKCFEETYIFKISNAELEIFVEHTLYRCDMETEVPVFINLRKYREGEFKLGGSGCYVLKVKGNKIVGGYHSHTPQQNFSNREWSKEELLESIVKHLKEG